MSRYDSERCIHPVLPAIRRTPPEGVDRPGLQLFAVANRSSIACQKAAHLSPQYFEMAGDMECMSTNSINSLANSYIQSVLGTAATSANANPASVSAPSVPQPDNGQLSSFAQMMNTLQQLQKSNPSEYQQVTAQIATNLQTAAKTATADGNAPAAKQLTQLATDFTNASQNAQPLSMQNVAKAMSGGHHHHHGGGGGGSKASSDSDSSNSTSSTGSTSSSSSTSPLSQFLASLQSSSSQNSALDPSTIIANTLASAGITSSSAA
jgi:hypothetical protein